MTTPSNHPSRRQFIRNTIAAGGALALSSFAAKALAQADKAPAGKADGGKFRLLVLGGTGFIGPCMIEAALAKGWSVTAFNRGRTEKKRKEINRELPFMDKIEVLYGNRDPEKHADDADPNSPKGLESLKGRTWDAVIDTSGFVPRIVRASAELLAAAGVKHYTFISSISVYAKNDQPNKDESDALGVMADPTVEDMGKQFENYGPLKVLCEQAAEKAFPGRCANIRPGFIVGPGDPTDRFTYWPWRAQHGGEMLLPGTPDMPIQFIDARDLGEWNIRVIEKNITGVFNATCPQMKQGDFFKACIDASNDKPTPVWVPFDFLEKFNEKAPAPADVTICISGDGEGAGFHRRDVGKAARAGLTFRPVDVTVKDTLAWLATMPAERQAKLRAGMSRDTEASVIKQWKESGAKAS